MKQILKYTAIITMTIFVVILSIGMHVTKIQCAKGERVFIGTDVSACKMQEKTTSCCKKKEIVKFCKYSEKEGKPQKESKLLQFDFEILKYKFGETIDFNIAQPVCLLLFNFIQNTNSELCYIKHYSDAPPLVNQPILSQIQSFLL